MHVPGPQRRTVQTCQNLFLGYGSQRCLTAVPLGSLCKQTNQSSEMLGEHEIKLTKTDMDKHILFSLDASDTSSRSIRILEACHDCRCYDCGWHTWSLKEGGI
eukprot:scaffold102015_cov21-Prasinocladus_malaysianus.AAC.1